MPWNFFSNCFNTSLPPLNIDDWNNIITDQERCPTAWSSMPWQWNIWHAMLTQCQQIQWSRWNFSSHAEVMCSQHLSSVEILFNLSICSGQIPAAWKVSNAAPIRKSSGNGTPSGYRPISQLVNTEQGIWEAYLTTYTEASHNPLSLQQWGFQSSKSTTSACIDSCHKPLATRNRKDIYTDDLLLCLIIYDQRGFIHLQIDIGKCLTGLMRTTWHWMLLSDGHPTQESVLYPWNMSLPCQSTPWTSEGLQVPGVLLNSSLNWSTHIHSICSRARRIVRLLYRTFAAHSNSSSLLQLYILLCVLI